MRSTSADVQRQGYQDKDIKRIMYLCPESAKYPRAKLLSLIVRTLEGAAVATEIGSSSFDDGMVETAVDEIAGSRLRVGLGH